MLSRRSFAKLCGLSTLPLFGFKAEAASPVLPDYSVARTVTLDSNLLMPDIARVFTKTTDLEFPLDFAGGGEHSIRLIPYMTSTCIDYDSKHKSRFDVISRATEIGANGLRQKIEVDMLSLLFCAGLESGIVRSWKHKNTKWSRNAFMPYRKFIMSPETIENCFGDISPSADLICSHLLGKDQDFQQSLLAEHEQKFNGDICFRLDNRRVSSIVLTNLPNLPPLMGFNTSFVFDAKTCKVTEKPFRKDGRETISLAYFCAMGVLDSKAVFVLDVNQ
jgi:hypothetical protein